MRVTWLPFIPQHRLAIARLSGADRTSEPAQGWLACTTSETEASLIHMRLLRGLCR
jgi:hypothetical protein